MNTLILGGARSGKSQFAETTAKQLAVSLGYRLNYVATALPFDHEMQARIAHHQMQRGQGWREHECPLDLARLLESFSAQEVVLVDCLTLWLNNWIFELADACCNTRLEAEIGKLCRAIERSPATLIFVSNEVGMGIVPMGEVSRYFVDNAGRMNQRLAQLCDQVTFVAAGLPMTLKQQGVG
ncbi:bifunctional adenosylcobinamide kinase/adenosylcobinamide-phosphate guanylyltransferase [Vibrio sp. CAU 1672]|uniref:bifunctional adenosylcobinamide kinase/adenosylcobinamide-phosphate guanylyltransferase n=1 Tax=Vibrio sp. CAU 1672 TaxID=3032594 RepID=UPI0023DB4903|nr:bifunctional adenosylcobinamide kinase/adenosylcobinamide-phosphate guanylyltransferase [Vibrio sp. CAU 1672]MDF2152326.1 bifunctional adenosylcobinamide kinase/adenosylcobinamide-phosphate guanylyltransferase [Vibrio sp. CAU 1672]